MNVLGEPSEGVRLLAMVELWSGNQSARVFRKFSFPPYAAADG